MVGGVDDVLGDDGVLVEVLRLGHDAGPGEVDGVAEGVDEAVPRLRDAIVGHLRRDQVRVFVRWKEKRTFQSVLLRL